MYIDSDVAIELNLYGQKQKVTVNTLNSKVDYLKTTPVEFQLESLDSKVKRAMQAFTENRVTGILIHLSWNAITSKASNLK